MNTYVFFITLANTFLLCKLQAKVPRRRIKGEELHWQVQLISYNAAGKAAHCFGALISDQWVLTAAHCLRETINIIQTNSAFSSLCDEDAVIVVGNESIKHPDYNNRLAVNDLGLIKLIYPVKFSDTVKSIRLANKDKIIGRFETVMLAGRGQSLEANNRTLHYTVLSTISNTDCKEFFNEDSITNGTLCTLSFASPCYGDGGSGLVQYVNDEPILVGIVAFAARNKCEKGGPTGYMRVSYYRDWIKEVTGL